MLEQLIQYDKELFLLLNNLGSNTWDDFWMFMTSKYSSIPLYLLLLFLLYRQLGLKKTGLVIIFVALTIACTNGLADFFKYGVQRLRPCYDTDLDGLVRLVKSSCGGKFSYFSAHASNTMGVAFFFTLLLKSKNGWVGILLISWAFIVAYSRIYIGVHFPLDVISGMVIGAFFGWVFVKLFIFTANKFRL